MATQSQGPLTRLLREAERDRLVQLGELKRRHTAYYAVGRVLLATLFIVRGLFKIRYYDASLGVMASEGYIDAQWVMPIAVLIEIGCGVMLAIGYQTRAAAVALIGYVSMLTLMFHWDLRLAENLEVGSLNVALVGGLLTIVGHGSGAFSVDRSQARRAKQHHEPPPEGAKAA